MLKDFFGKTQDEKKRNIVRIIYLTVTVILILSVALAITLAVGQNGNDGASGDDTSDASGTVLKPTLSDTKKGTLLVVNSQSNAFDFTVNSEKSLVSISNNSNLYSLKTEGMKANKEALAALNKMLGDFYKQAGASEKKVTIYTAYRSFEDQGKLLNSSVPAGNSDFHTGMLFELTIDGTATSIKSDSAFNWIYENAYKYGFVDRYPIGKSSYTGVSDFDNAFRYVGTPHAKYMKDNNLCLEEYVSRVQTATEPIMADGYKITYVKANTEGNTEIPLSSKAYSISGDNMGGFIVASK